MKKLLLILLLMAFSPVFASAEDIPYLDNAQLTDILEKNKGKTILLNFFATWCPPCRVELPELVKVRNAVPEKELTVIGLSVDDDQSPVSSFIKEAGVNYPVYMADKSITDNFGISSVPHNVFYAPNGKMEISEPGMAEAGLLETIVRDLLTHK
ncbi:MAG: TlpA family protein disulfide reductase [Desulfovibrio sp.]|nr:TlpA family protein disulfide reductase [Desulfovibrio sp.]